MTSQAFDFAKPARQNPFSEDMNKEFRTALKGIVASPLRTAAVARAGIVLRYQRPFRDYQNLVATHHKVLTVYLARIFKGYSRVTGQTFSMGSRANPVDYTRDIVLNQHSKFEQNKFCRQIRGLHVRRDPRDVLVSSTMYHMKSKEPWLHRPGAFGIEESSYQEKLNSLATMDQKLEFEMRHAAGQCISEMQQWDYNQSGIAEFRYEDLMSPDAPNLFSSGLTRVGFSDIEAELLANLFVLFSSQGKLANRKHIRNPKSQQWKEYFTPAIERQFQNRFPNVLGSLGYE